MTPPYAIVSDRHNHLWSAFSGTTPGGMNTRLEILINEMYRCAEELRKAGGHVIYDAGDVFHVRGSIAPSVLNPVLDCHRDLMRQGFEFRFVPGNHDQEGRHTARISNALTALESIGCMVAQEPTVTDDVMLVPWFDSVKELKVELERIARVERDAGHDTSQMDLIIHAPVNGVILGIPDHGLEPKWLAGLGFRRVLSGHYHNHVDFGNGVYSIGAIAHHSWSDVGTKAGFLIVSDTGVKWHQSHAPDFVELDGTEGDDLPLIVDGNYVKVKVDAEADRTLLDALRVELNEYGARGVVFQPVKSTSTVARGAATVKTGVTLDASIQDFITAKAYARPANVFDLCQKALASVEE